MEQTEKITNLEQWGDRGGGSCPINCTLLGGASRVKGKRTGNGPRGIGILTKHWVITKVNTSVPDHRGEGLCDRARIMQESEIMDTHGITSFKETEINRRRFKDGLLESVLQELCAAEGVADDPVVDSGQCRSHRFGVLFVASESRVIYSESRRPRNEDAQQLMLDNNKRPADPQSPGESP